MIRNKQQAPLLEISLPPDADAPRRARLALASVRGVRREVLEKAQLVVCELVSNSIRHARLSPGDRIKLRVGVNHGRLWGEVLDNGPGFVPPPLATGYRGDGTDGRGLWIVHSLTAAWGVVVNGGTRVWFEVSS